MISSTAAATVHIAGTLEIVAVPVEPGQSIVQLAGEVDLTTAGLLAAALTEQLARGCCCVRLDLSRLTFMDAAGLRVLVRAHNEFLFAGGTLVLTGPTSQVTRLLRITQLDEALFVADGAERRPARHLRSVPTEQVAR